MSLCRCGCDGEAMTSTGWKQGHWNMGLRRSAKTRELMSRWQIGKKKGPNPKISAAKKGKRLPDEVYARAGKTRRERGVFAGEKNPNWDPDREAVRVRGLMYRAQTHMLKRVMKRAGTRKAGHTDKELGYSTTELRQHLERLFLPGMTWKNYGKGPGHWNVDHVKEVRTFSRDADPREINRLSNLRPLWWEDNIARNRSV